MALRRGPLLFVIALLVCLAALGAFVAYVKLRPSSDIPDYALTLEVVDEHPSADDMERARQVLLHRMRIAKFDGARVERAGDRRLVMHARGEGMDALRGLAERGRLRLRPVLATSPGTMTTEEEEDAVPEVGDTARPAVADRLGDAYTAAAKATSFKEGRKLPKAVLDAFRALGAQDVATLPLRMQMVVPAITCDRLRPGADDPARLGVMCAGDDETKYLVDKTDIVSADIADCVVGAGPQGLVLDVRMTRDGQPRLTAITRVLAPEHESLAVVVDGLVVTAATVQAEIPGDIELTQGSNMYAAKLLCARIGGGELPMAFTEIA